MGTGGLSTTVRRYNATTDLWTSLANIPLGSEAPAGAFFGGKIYVADGCGGANSIRIYDIGTNTWSDGPTRPGNNSSCGAAAGAFNGNVYVVGGSSGGASSVLSIYNIAGNTWSTGPAAPSPYYFGGYTQIGQFLYVIGGVTNTIGGNSTVSMRLDMATNTWSTGPVWTPARADFALAAVGTKLIAIGGDNNGGASAQVDELDTNTWPGGTWVPSPDNLPSPRQGNSAGFVSTGRVGGEIWSTGGRGLGNVYLDAHLFRTQAPANNITSGGATILSPGPNGVLDPGVTVTVALGARNTGGPGVVCTTTGLTGTLQATGGVTNPTGPRNYGAICFGDPVVSRSFTFTISPSLACGDTVTASLVMTDGATNYGTLTYTFRTGTQVGDFSENFDGLVAPALPTGWVATNAQGPAPLWVTSITTPETSPNDAFVDDPAVVSDKYLDTPGISITSASAKVSFRNNYNLEVGGFGDPFDGGVLEVSSPNINGGAFTDVTDAAVGGSFVSGGYNGIIDTGFGNPLAGRMAWSGNSGGYINTVANLGPNVAGQTIKLRFRMGSDSDTPGAGWRIDTILVTESACAPTLLVTTTAEHDDGVCNAADCTLREAINAANARAGSIIGFTAGVTGTIQLTSPLPTLFNSSIALQGPGARLLTVQRNSGAASRIFTICCNPGVVVSISGLTIAAGILINDNGGAISNQGSLTLTDCAILNSVVIGSTTNGGGLYNASGATLALFGCTVSGNSAGQFGGGVYNDGTFTATNCTFENDAALNGGGIYSSFNNNASKVSLRNCTITQCRATSNGTATGDGGGGYYAQGNAGQYNLGNSIVAGNVSSASPPTNPDVRGNFTSDGHNFIGNVGFSSGFIDGTNGDQIGTNAQPKNPMLDPVRRNNGGPTDTHALLAGSTAINAGDDNLAPLKDQRGYTRSGISDIGGFEYQGILTPLTAVSRKMHGSSMFDISLPLTGTAGVECRTGGVNGDHQVIMTFPSPVTVTSASVTTGIGSVSGYTISGSQVTVNLTGVSNAQRIVLTLFGVSDGTNTSNVSIPMGVLLGDTSGNGAVSSTDVSQTKLQSGQAVSASNFREDVVVNGSINSSDVSTVKLKSGTALP